MYVSKCWWLEPNVWVGGKGSCAVCPHTPEELLSTRESFKRQSDVTLSSP